MSIPSQGLKKDYQSLIANLKVLIVNDEIFILAMLQEIMNQSGITNIDQAQNGFDGYQLVLKKNYDIILCDLNMPVMNGYECAKKIKAQYQPKQSLFNINEQEQQCPLLIAYSALITDDIEAKCKQHGFDLCLQSPISFQMINEKVLPIIFSQFESKIYL